MQCLVHQKRANGSEKSKEKQNGETKDRYYLDQRRIFPPLNSTAFQFPIAMKKKKTNTQIINLVKEIKIIRTKFHKMWVKSEVDVLF